MSDISKYPNFVPQSVQYKHDDWQKTIRLGRLNGIETKNFYDKVISAPNSKIIKIRSHPKNTPTVCRASLVPKETCNNNDLLLAAQRDDYETLRECLARNPDKLNITDEYGWSLLMIACQANAVNSVKLLLSLNIDRYVRDKAGNSANTILIRQKNTELINIFLEHKSLGTGRPYQKRYTVDNEDTKRQTPCSVCGHSYNNKESHMISTIHNMHLCKGKRIIPHYTIPENNRGFQILVKSGWDKDNGLGPSGSGKLYPIKSVLKDDKLGLGSKNVKRTQVQSSRAVTSSTPAHVKDKSFEINFRRQFYD